MLEKLADLAEPDVHRKYNAMKFQTIPQKSILHDRKLHCGKSIWTELIAELTACSVLQVVGALLIGSAAYGNRFTDLPIIPSVIACGVVLISLALMGLYGAVKHHQVTLFFYMIILFCLFIVQFAIACSCLAVNKTQQRLFAEEGWNTVSEDTKAEVQRTFNCCGFNSTLEDDHPSCDTVNKICCPTGSLPSCACSPCLPKLETNIDSAFFVSGSIGLFFSFTEVSKEWNYRENQQLTTSPLLTQFQFSAIGRRFNSPLSKSEKSPCFGLLVNSQIPFQFRFDLEIIFNKNRFVWFVEPFPFSSVSLLFGTHSLTYSSMVLSRGLRTSLLSVQTLHIIQCHDMRESTAQSSDEQKTLINVCSDVHSLFPVHICFLCLINAGNWLIEFLFCLPDRLSPYLLQNTSETNVIRCGTFQWGRSSQRVITSTANTRGIASYHGS